MLRVHCLFESRVQMEGIYWLKLLSFLHMLIDSLITIRVYLFIPCQDQSHHLLIHLRVLLFVLGRLLRDLIKGRFHNLFLRNLLFLYMLLIKQNMIIRRILLLDFFNRNFLPERMLNRLIVPWVLL